MRRIIDLEFVDMWVVLFLVLVYFDYVIYVSYKF